MYLSKLLLTHLNTITFPERCKGGAKFSRGHKGAKRVEWQFAWLCDNELYTDTPHLASEQGNGPSSNKAVTHPYLWVASTFQGGFLAAKQNSDGRFI